jgi:hypothetical protein
MQPPVGSWRVLLPPARSNPATQATSVAMTERGPVLSPVPPSSGGAEQGGLLATEVSVDGVVQGPGLRRAPAAGSRGGSVRRRPLLTPLGVPPDLRRVSREIRADDHSFPVVHEDQPP